jgi:hypothetical protein
MDYERIVIALSMIGSLFYLVAFKDKDGLQGCLVNVLFALMGFYFGHGPQ